MRFFVGESNPMHGDGLAVYPPKPRIVAADGAQGEHEAQNQAQASQADGELRDHASHGSDATQPAEVMAVIPIGPHEGACLAQVRKVCGHGREDYPRRPPPPPPVVVAAPVVKVQSNRTLPEEVVPVMVTW